MTTATLSNNLNNTCGVREALESTRYEENKIENKIYESISSDENYREYFDSYEELNSLDSQINDVNDDTEYEQSDGNVKKWCQGTVCILGDSILCNLDEKRLGRNSMVKVRYHRGGTVEDMFYHVKPILQRAPTYIILHVGTNNSPFQDSRTILNNILKLKHLIESELPSCTVIVSTPVMRQDNQKANFTIRRLNSFIQNLKIRVLNNDNIDERHLGRKGLHLNERGIGRLALNIISHIRCL